MEFATDINNVMYAYIDRKKKFPVTTLLRSIGYETDKDILELFGMADEVKADKKGLAEISSARSWPPACFGPGWKILSMRIPARS